MYRWAEYVSLGSLLERTREHFLPLLRDHTRALVLGDGDGRFLCKLLESNPHLHANAVDTSAVMLSLLNKRCRKHTGRLVALHASALSVEPSIDTDLIVSHFFLDCFTQEEVDLLVQRISHAVRPGTVWLVSDFVVPQTSWLRLPAAIYIRLLYFAFRVTTGLRVQQLPDAASPLLRSNFRRVARHTFLFGILYTELWELAGEHSVDPVEMPNTHKP